MPEITVTETQRETLKEIRSDLEAAYIDTYGHIQTKDVVQYLLDTYSPPEQQTDEVAHRRIATAEFPLLQQIAADVEGVPGSGIDTETMRGELLSALGVSEFAARLTELDTTGDSDIGAEKSGTESDGSDDATPDNPSATAEGSPTDSGDGPDADNSAGSDQTTGSSESVLSAANQLLDTHDEKWREGSGEEPYEVDLPDGTTKQVRTKDDIRQVLFKQY